MPYYTDCIFIVRLEERDKSMRIQTVVSLAFVAACITFLASCGNQPEANVKQPEANVEQNEANGEQPEAKDIFDAAIKGDLNAVKAFLEKNRELLESKNKDGMTLLFFAARGNRRKVVEYLLSQGADVNDPCDSGKTALHDVAFWGEPEMAQLLILNGANVSVRDKQGLTPLMWAMSNRNQDVADVLRQNGAKE